MTDVSSMASSGYCGQAHHGTICRRALGLTRPAYNRFVRWRMAGIWDSIMEAFAKAHDSSVQMIDTLSASTSMAVAREVAQQG